MRCKKGREETLICKLQKTHALLTKYYLFIHFVIICTSGGGIFALTDR